MTSPAAPAAIAVVPYSTFNSLRLGRNINKNGDFMGITILLLDELRAYLLRRGATRHDASSFTTLETLMNHKANIRALFQSNGWILSQTAVKPEEGREVECCVLEDGCRQCVISTMKISVALIYATTVLELPNKY
ncbi:BnaUnng03190D [Brassica napus]|uniref:BnaUnng03190D protein n=1 Tax=Brassica napus TaxID=3708 RepID=A0A078JUZ9_BRANA|nr:BnaUnng03190D [Brassica napus]